MVLRAAELHKELFMCADEDRHNPDLDAADQARR
jgi:hypothetical protein